MGFVAVLLVRVLGHGADRLALPDAVDGQGHARTLDGFEGRIDAKRSIIRTPPGRALCRLVKSQIRFAYRASILRPLHLPSSTSLLGRQHSDRRPWLVHTLRKPSRRQCPAKRRRMVRSVSDTLALAHVDDGAALIGQRA